MDHVKADMLKVPQRYLLNELTEAESEEFDEHMFSCAVCADDVRAGVLFLAGAKYLILGPPNARQRG